MKPTYSIISLWSEFQLEVYWIDMALDLYQMGSI